MIARDERQLGIKTSYSAICYFVLLLADFFFSQRVTMFAFVNHQNNSGWSLQLSSKWTGADWFSPDWVIKWGYSLGFSSPSWPHLASLKQRRPLHKTNGSMPLLFLLRSSQTIWIAVLFNRENQSENVIHQTTKTKNNSQPKPVRRKTPEQVGHPCYVALLNWIDSLSLFPSQWPTEIQSVLIACAHTSIRHITI